MPKVLVELLPVLGAAGCTADVAENKVDGVAVLRKFTIQRGSQRANRSHPIVLVSTMKRMKNNQASGR